MLKTTGFDPATFGIWNREISAQKNQKVQWIWEGFIPYPGITLLTGAPKLGKSTLVSLLLDRRRQGGELLGRPVRPGTTVVLSEEEDSLWAARQQHLDFGPEVCFCRPDVSTFRRWNRFTDKLTELAMHKSVNLLVIDSLSSFFPASENHPRSLHKALEELRSDFFAMGVLLVHHPRRKESRPGSAARGSGALAALTDVVLDLRLPGKDPFTRRRQLYGLGRFPGTMQKLHIELNPEGTDYTVLPGAEDAALFVGALDALRDLVGRASSPLTRQQILDRWRTDLPRANPTTLWRLLLRACDLGILARHGDGTKNDPFRFELSKTGRQSVPPGTEEKSGNGATDPPPTSPASPPPESLPGRIILDENFELIPASQLLPGEAV